MDRNVALLLALSLAGCAPLGGAAYEVKFASSSSVTIAYNPSLTDDDTVQDVAQQTCALYGKDALAQATFHRQPGLFQGPPGLSYKSFTCQDRS